jgi:hypothetical protein
LAAATIILGCARDGDREKGRDDAALRARNPGDPVELDVVPQLAGFKPTFAATF